MLAQCLTFTLSQVIEIEIIVKFEKTFHSGVYHTMDELENEREVELKRLEKLQRKRHRDIIVLTAVTTFIGVAMLMVILFG